MPSTIPTGAGVPSKRSVSVLLLGDSQCGKTSLIITLVSGRFPAVVPAVLSQVRIAPVRALRIFLFA